MSHPDDRDYVYRIIFIQNNKEIELYSKQLTEESLMGFIEIEELIFSENAGIVVDTEEEKLKQEFEGVQRTYIPMHSVLRIDEVTKRGVSTIRESTDSKKSNVSAFPGIKHPPRSRED